MTESLTFELNFNILFLKFDKFILFWLTVQEGRPGNLTSAVIYSCGKMSLDDPLFYFINYPN